ncbi:MAG: adenosylcobinamide-GDP ribazoletransferase [Nitrospirae bacterium]|nr:adenosylcobinamide-GDP ribazoletransferase [Candidatus Manganitrophaceae bacterium]
MRDFWTAVSVLTVFPARRNHAAPLPASVHYFPAVGFLIGFALMGTARMLRPLLPPGPLAALIVLLLMVITGGLHLDGLADLCDGLAAGGDRARILAVMKDSRIGAFGVMGLIVILLLKYALFYELIAHGALYSFLIMGTVSRWAMVLAAFVGRYAREEGTAKPFIGKIGWGECAVSTALALIFACAIRPVPGFLSFLIVLPVLFFLNRLLEAKIGGWTGDALGALNEISEVLVLFLIVAISPLIET